MTAKLLLFVLHLFPVSLLSAQWYDVRTAPWPPPRTRAAFAYDLANDRCVMFGGVVQNGPLLDDTWTFDGRLWTQHVGASPLLRQDAAMTYDILRGVVVLFGGMSGWTFLNDTWEWNGSSWNSVATPNRPPAFQVPTLSYDAFRGRTVLLSETSETWEYDGVTWRRVVTARVPPPRPKPAMCFDMLRARTVMFGGGAYLFPTQTDTWTYDGIDWIELPIAGPPPRTFAQMTYDWQRNVCVLAGGVGPYFVPRTDAWEFGGAGWTQVAAPPMLGSSHYTAFDVVRSRLVVVSCNEPGPTTVTWVRGARADPFGTGCAGTAGEPMLAASLPYPGVSFQAMLTNTDPRRTVAAVLLGHSRTSWSGGILPADLQSLGMPGCTLWSSIDEIELLPVTGGSGVWTTQIPNDSALVGAEAFLTGVSFDDVNAFGAVLSRPLQLLVGR